MLWGERKRAVGGRAKDRGGGRQHGGALHAVASGGR